MKRFDTSILAAAFLASVYSGQAGSTSPMAPRPDPWYAIEIEIDPASLPAGLEWSGPRRGFRNRSDVPVYLVRPVDPPMEWKQFLPGDLLPKEKIVNGGLHRFEHRGWRFIAPRDPPRGITLTSPTLISEAHRKLLFDQPKGRGRPGNLPPPLSITIQGYMGSKSVSLNVDVHYKFAERYRPDSAHSPWYSIDYATVEAAPQTEGLAIRKLRKFGRPYDMELVNTSDTPFYTVAQFESTLDWISETPVDTLPIYKLVSGKVYSPQFFPRMSMNGRKPVRGWFLNRDDHVAPFRSWLEVAATGIEINDVREDCRPEDAQPPSPQPFNAVIVHDKKKMPIKGRVVYRLNPDYDPVAGQGPPVCAGCTGAMCIECARMNRRAKEFRDNLGDFCKKMRVN